MALLGISMCDVPTWQANSQRILSPIVGHSNYKISWFQMAINTLSQIHLHDSLMRYLFGLQRRTDRIRSRQAFHYDVTMNLGCFIDVAKGSKERNNLLCSKQNGQPCGERMDGDFPFLSDAVTTRSKSSFSRCLTPKISGEKQRADIDMKCVNA